MDLRSWSMEGDARRLDVSVVVYHSDPAELQESLESLGRAVSRAREAALVNQAMLWLR